uniref:Uncharacterized protein n=1 Tax=Rhizophora mucronata TaxID=61149 RepID=A0A2P2NHA0_RHIMU
MLNMAIAYVIKMILTDINHLILVSLRLQSSITGYEVAWLVFT